MPYRDLAEDIPRQIILMEFEMTRDTTKRHLVKYGKRLGEVLDMVVDTKPLVKMIRGYGWTAWGHWKTSGWHGYTWKRRKPAFLSFVVYTCKPFSLDTALRFTADHFGITVDSIQYKEIISIPVAA